MPIKKRDTRTALEKWDQGISEARFRGYWHRPKRPVPEGLFCGWDHTKPTNRNHANHDIVPVQLPSRGIIAPDCRDDTDDEVFVVVTRLGPVTRQGRETVVDQTTTRVPCLPARRLGQAEIAKALDSRSDKMGNKVKKKWEFDKEGGPRWKEWCIWDDQYIWQRYHELGREYRQPRQPINDYSLTDLGYRNARGEMERLASSQGIPSWTQLTRREPIFREEALYARFENYLKLSKHTNSGKSRPLPQSWSGRGFHPLNYDIHSEAFKSELKWSWTRSLHLFFHPEDKEKLEKADVESQQQHIPSTSLDSFGRNDSSHYQQAIPAYQSTGLPVGDQQYYQRNSDNHTTQLPRSRIFRPRHSSQMDYLLPADLLGDDDHFQEPGHLADQNHYGSRSNLLPGGRHPRHYRG